MTMNPLVEKIYQSTVQKSLDLEILNELDFKHETGCESEVGAHGCTGDAIWVAMAACGAREKLVCNNAKRAADERFKEDPTPVCRDCATMAEICFYYVPIPK